MKIGIMQPYFFPYLGYWQLMNAVDKYVIYDNIQYTKKGWFNRNRFLLNGHDELFSINLVKDSDYLDVYERKISSEFERKKLVLKFRNAYMKAPYFKENFGFVEEIINYDNNNLFEYIFNSIVKLHKLFGMKSDLIISSSLKADHSFKAENRVKAIIKELGGDEYINAIGGRDLYSAEDFAKEGINLQFLKTRDVVYPQFKNDFVSNLSIIDVMMFNSVEQIKKLLGEFDLVKK